jgi:mRNA interferase RelE/StbE
VPYQITFAPSAAREFRKLTRDLQLRLRPAIDTLADNPRPHGVEKLTGQENLYRIREGDYRIVYEIRDAVLVVVVVAIGDRKEIYRRFR